MFSLENIITASTMRGEGAYAKAFSSAREPPEHIHTHLYIHTHIYTHTSSGRSIDYQMVKS
ncbi:hypothetical protein OIU79_002989 [Salix purpurea]|uniref:Uncharacterized protein n=1 Tax=Salix purpurea TaxID=77065 RepID=A0A9Q0UKW3_SALPP|nr:hypothetical protein OIU79_002989 [Salix purpurea]